MHRQTLIAKEDHQYRKKFQKNSPRKTLSIYLLIIITYSTAFAKHLALQTIQQLCKNEKMHPVAA